MKLCAAMRFLPTRLRLFAMAESHANCGHCIHAIVMREYGGERLADNCRIITWLSVRMTCVSHALEEREHPVLWKPQQRMLSEHVRHIAHAKVPWIKQPLALQLQT